MSDVIERDDEGERRRRKCRCCVCGRVEECQPRFDFYTTRHTGPLLVGECCLYASDDEKRDALAAYKEKLH